MHYWGDGFKYFGEVGQAADFIGTYCRKWGRINVTQTKEKYGTARVYCGFGWYQLHSITHPGYVYSQYPDWLWKLDCMFFSKLLRPFQSLIARYQIFIYRRAYELTFKKWPLIKEEIIQGADYPEFVSSYWEPIPACSKHADDIQQSMRFSNNEDCLLCQEEKNASIHKT
jgi:hypothetical protein